MNRPRRFRAMVSGRLPAILVAGALSLTARAASAIPCASQQDCPAPSVCNTATHQCVGCVDDSPCRAPAPVCDTVGGFCSGCRGDFGSGETAHCPSAHPVCITAGSHAGECADCSATNTTACGTVTRPICVASLGLCGCGSDADCEKGTYCDHAVAAAGWCVFGCHVVGGVDTCPAGNHCDARDGTIGNCRAGECSADADCGDMLSGRVCANGACAAGCRGQGGNGCAAPLVCSSRDGTVGACGAPMDAGTTVDASSAPDAGEPVNAGDAAADAAQPIVAPSLGGCVVSGGRSDESLPILGVVLAGAAIARRVRRNAGRR